MKTVLAILLAMFCFVSLAQVKITQLSLIPPKKNITKIKVSERPLESNPELEAYLKKLLNFIEESFRTSKKGTVNVRMQVQRKGQADLLYIQSQNAKLQIDFEQWLGSQSSLPKIPKMAGQRELQLSLTIEAK